MSLATPQIYAPSEAGSLRQGELISGVVQFKRSVGEGETIDAPKLIRVTHPFAAVVTQDCDLVWDYQARQAKSDTHKLLPSILFCEVIEAEKFRSRSDIKSDIWRRIKSNKDERYQYLEEVSKELDSSQTGLPDFAIDFKRFFCLPTDDIYQQLEKQVAVQRSRLLSPYAEHLTCRFFYFHSRVALPRDHGRKPAE